MKNNYNIKTDLPKLDAEQINKHQDFDSLLAQFEQTTPTEEDGGKSTSDTKVKPIDNKISPWIAKSGIGILMTMAASILVVFMIQNGNNTTLTEQVNNQLALQSPMPDLAPAFERATVADATQGGLLQYPSGSVVKVPAAAFVDKEGQAVTGAVDIDYRELNTAVDLFLAGVPQERYEQKNIQSAGMIEIRGTQAGEPVYMHQDKSLEVSFRGEATNEIAAADLKIYAFDVAENDWEYQAVDGVKVIEEITYNTTQESQEEERQKVKEAWAVKMPVAPRKPQSVPNNMQPFDFDLDKEQFPNLAHLGNEVEFLVKKSAVADDPFSREWNDMKVKNLGNDKLEVILIRNSASGAVLEELNLEIIPFVAYSDAAQARYNRQLENYNTALAQWEEGQSAALAALQKEQKHKMWVHHFEVKAFGLWACGKEIDLDKKDVLSISFVDNNGNEQQLREIFVAVPSQKEYHSLRLDNNTEAQLRVDATANYQVWGFTPQNELVVANTTGNRPTNGGEAIDFVFKPAGTVPTIEEMKQLLTM